MVFGIGFLAVIFGLALFIFIFYKCRNKASDKKGTYEKSAKLDFDDIIE